MRGVRRADINPITKQPYHTIYNCSYFLYLVTNPVIDIIESFQYIQGKYETTIKINENHDLAQFKTNVNEYFDLSIDDLSSELNDDLNTTILQFDLLNQFNTGLNYAKGLFYFDAATGILFHRHFPKISKQLSLHGIQAIEKDYDLHFEVMQYFIERALTYCNILIQSLLIRENTKEHPIRFYPNESKKTLES